SLLGAVVLLGAIAAWPLLSGAQGKQPADPPKHKHPDQKASSKDLADQIRDLQAKVAKLEAALKQEHEGTSDTDRMGGMMNMVGGMGGKKEGKGAMGGMMEMMMGGKDGMGLMDGDMMEMMGMMGMGSMGQGDMKGMKVMGKMKITAALPGFPGASHIYHI